ncbi:VOC family protein [Actinophytocola sp.]|uniref:VOC family protein n=1 Tax=Actinophytocola sp. TaxID=1872138 RepID=UPI003D6A518D
MTKWGLTVDCAQPGELARFWALALGYVASPPPGGFASTHEWLASLGVPEEEWDDAAYLTDPAGVGPTISFLTVPEPKVVKNRLHVDVKAGGGRQTPWDVRWPRVLDMVERLKAAGATVVRQYDDDGRGDHVMMADPEGNEFCVV